MKLDDKALAFLEKNHSAAMTTLRADGTPHSVRCGVGLVDGKLWSSGTKDRVRTKHLRRDPRCSLFVFDAQWAYLSLDATVTILDGPDSPDMSVRLFRLSQDKPSGPLNWFGRELEEDEFKEVMVQEGRLIYEFEVLAARGLY